MKQKIILSIAILSLLSLAVFVSALSDQDQIETSANVEKGWNLISNGIFAINPSQDSEIKIEDISAIYYYDSQEKEYKLIYPLGQLTHEEEEEIEDVIMKEVAPAVWVYSEKSGNLKFTTDDVYPTAQRPLFSGWNLVSITPAFIGDNNLKSLNSMKGSCNIERAYFWDGENSKWLNVPLNEKISDVLFEYDRLLGNGLAVKVSGNCNLGSGGSSVNPPTLPGSNGNDAGFLIERDISPFSFRERNERAYWKGDCSFTNKGEECDYYRAIYDYSGEGIDVIEVQIEVPSTTWDIAESTFSEIDGQLEGNVFSDDEYWNGNFYWFSQSTKESETTMDRFLSWESDDKLIMITIDDYDSEKFDWNLMEGFIDAYFNKYPSSYQS